MTVRILIVDDLPFNRRVMRLLLTHPSFVIVGEAENGRDALAFLAENDQTDLVVMDVNMPEMNGLEATRHIKANWPQTKVLVTSIREDYEAEALASGAEQFLPKSSGLTTICDTILTLVDADASASAATC